MPDPAPKPSLVERLFAEQRGALKAFFQRRARPADAADLSQEVYLRMLRIRDPAAIRDPVLYLFTVANNLVKEQRVLDQRRRTDVDIEAVATQEQLGVPPNFEGELDSAQRSARLQSILKQLGPKYQAAVILRFTQELSYREVASRMGVSPEMARKYVVRALSHCRRRMARMR